MSQPEDQNRPSENQLASVLQSALSVNRVAVRIPPFIPTDPELWFSMVEENFISAGVTTDSTKFGYITGVLEPRYALEVRDIIVNKPAVNAYETLKFELIKRLSSSQEEKTRRLLELQEMGDRKPSQFLRHLQGLAGTAVPENMLRTLWFGRLPANMQAILAAHRDLSLQKIADLADSINDLTRNRSCVIAETANAVTNNDLLAAQLQQLTLTVQQEIASIREDMQTLRKTAVTNSRGRPWSRSRSRPRSRSRSRGNPNGVCWYHARYGPGARKCTQPCSFNQGNEAGGR